MIFYWSKVNPGRRISLLAKTWAVRLVARNPYNDDEKEEERRELLYYYTISFTKIIIINNIN